MYTQLFSYNINILLTFSVATAPSRQDYVICAMLAYIVSLYVCIHIYIYIHTLTLYYNKYSITAPDRIDMITCTIYNCPVTSFTVTYHYSVFSIML